MRARVAECRVGIAHHFFRGSNLVGIAHPTRDYIAARYSPFASMPEPPNNALRILDANLNRAREALRVMEEFARFVLDDATLTAEIKQTRHDLAAAIPATIDAGAIHRREIETDVGREIGTTSEYARTEARSVAIAAGKRLSEALRVIEEYGKTIDPAFAARVEQIRYRGYELERRLAITTTARDRFDHVRLYVLITESLCRRDWFETAQAAIDGGADCLQLREKNLADRELLDRAKRLASLCRERGALFVVNDRPDIAALANADGVHLGQDDLSVAAARRILPTSAIVGVSTHTIEQVQAAIAQAPDYVAVGPMFPSGTKPQDHIAGPRTLAAARSLTGLPLAAIGGIDATNAAQVLSAAPCALCVSSTVLADADPRSACRRLADLAARLSSGTAVA